MHIIAPFADAGATSTHFLAEGEKGGVLASLFLSTRCRISA